MINPLKLRMQMLIGHIHKMQSLGKTKEEIKRDSVTTNLIDSIFNRAYKISSDVILNAKGNENPNRIGKVQFKDGHMEEILYYMQEPKPTHLNPKPYHFTAWFTTVSGIYKMEYLSVWATGHDGLRITKKFQKLGTHRILRDFIMNDCEDVVDLNLEGAYDGESY